MAKTPKIRWWHFWHPQSGIVGGLIVGMLGGAFVGAVWLLAVAYNVR